MGRRCATPVFDAAIDWMVLLRSGESTPADAARHRAWCEADPGHAQAWAQVSGAVQRSLEPLHAARGDFQGRGAAMQAALLQPRRRKVLRNVLALAGVGLATGWLVDRGWPIDTLLADQRTGTGERRDLVLADGSRLVLNARSAVDIDFNPAERTLHLRAGELIVSVAQDAARPFVVRTLEGSVQALGTRFLVRQEDDQTRVLVLQHQVRLRTLAGDERILHKDEEAVFDPVRIAPSQPGDTGLSSWERGMLTANDRPLAEVIAALRPYHVGLIRLSEKAAQLRVLGAFPLDDPERAIESLAQTLRIRVTRYGGWLVVIDAAGQDG